MTKILKKIVPILFWLIFWELVSIIVHNQILLAGPVDTIKALIKLVPSHDFWLSVRKSSIRILGGFFIGAALGILLSFLAYKREFFKELIKPFIMILKSVPVASFVILLLIWFGSTNISILISAMVVFPIVYLSTLEGFESLDIRLLEMAKVFRMPETRVIRYIYYPSLMPFFKSSLKLSIGMAFKSGIAAEVIGQPLNTMGNALYNAKIYLETGELFAWTIVILVISFICEKVLLLLLRIGGRRFDH